MVVVAGGVGVRLVLQEAEGGLDLRPAKALLDQAGADLRRGWAGGWGRREE